MAFKVSPHLNLKKPVPPGGSKVTPVKTNPGIGVPKQPTQPMSYNAQNTGLGSNADAQRAFFAGGGKVGDTSRPVYNAQTQTTAPAQQTPQPNQGNQAFDMSQFTGMFDKYNQENTTRFSALEKMLQDLIGTNKYNAQQQTPQNSSQGVYDGTHQFTAPNQGNAVGYTQNNNAVNETLHKYLNNIWNGGF